MLVAMVASITRADAQDQRFINYTMADGLPSNIFYAITQSCSGYLWFGSDAGITRFDGHQFRSLLLDQSANPELFAVEPEQQPKRLPGASVQYLLNNGREVYAALESTGLAVLDENLQLQRMHTPYNTPSMPMATIWSMALAGPDQLWIGFSDAGLALYDRSTQTFSPYPLLPDDADSNSEDRPSILFIHHDDNDTVWVSTMQTGLYRKTANSEHFEPVKPASSSADAAPGRHLNLPSYVTSMTHDDDYLYALIKDRILLLDKATAKVHAAMVLQDHLDHKQTALISISLDGNGQLWISSRSGLYRVQLNLARDNVAAVQRFQYSPTLADSIVNNNTYFNYVDEDGGLWVATMEGGVIHKPTGWDSFKLLRRDPLSDNTLPDHRVRSLFSAGDQLWIGTYNNGVVRYDLDSNTYHMPAALQTLLAQRPQEQRINAMTQDASGRLWLGLSKTIASYTAEQGARFSKLEPRAVEVISNRLFSGIFAAGDGLWAIADSRYLLYYDAAKDIWRLFDIAAYTGNNSDQTLTAHAVLDDGSFIIATRRQVLHYHSDCHCMHTLIGYNQSLIQNMLLGDHGLYLVRGDQLELYSLDLTAAEASRALPLRQWQLPQNLSQAGIINMLQTDAGTLWLSTARAMLRLQLNQQTGMPQEMRVITQSDGLSNMELETNTLIRLDSERIAIAGSGGVALLQTDRLARELPVPAVLLQQVRSSKRALPLPANTAVATTPASRTQLAYDENTLFIHFQSILFTHRERLQFQYRLHGWDSGWIDNADNPQAVYSNLPSGDYRFQARARIGNQAWGPINEQLLLSISTPPWLSTAAITGYCLAGLLLLALTWQRRLQYHAQQRALALAGERQRFARQQSELATRLNRSIQPQQIARAMFETINKRIPLQGMQVNFASSDDWYSYPAEFNILQLNPAPMYERLRAHPDVQAALDAGLIDNNHAGLEQALLMPLGSKLPHRALALLWPQQPPDQEQTGFLQLASNMAGSPIDNCELLQQVTELAETNRRANEAKSEFIAMVSHEIRTPLHGLMGMLHLLDRHPQDGQDQLMLDKVNHSSKQLLSVLDDVLDISKIEAKKIELRSELFNLQQLCNSLHDLFLARVEQKNIYLVCLPAADLCTWRTGDQDRILQILTNLVSNAIKFTDSGGVMVCIRRHPDETDQQRQSQVLFEVYDTGIGIRQADQQRLFQRFQQVGEMTWQRYGGSGLGLAISHHLCEVLGGHLSVNSQPGEGSVFRASLPLGIPQGMQAIEPLQALPGVHLHIACDRASKSIAVLLQSMVEVHVMSTSAADTDDLPSALHKHTAAQSSPAEVQLLLTTSAALAAASPIPVAVLRSDPAGQRKQPAIEPPLFYLPGQWQELLAWLLSRSPTGA